MAHTVGSIVVDYIKTAGYDVFDYNKAINTCKEWNDILTPHKETAASLMLSTGKNVSKKDIEKLNVLVMAVSRNQISIMRAIKAIDRKLFFVNGHMSDKCVMSTISYFLNLSDELFSPDEKCVVAYCMFSFIVKHFRFCKKLTISKTFKNITYKKCEYICDCIVKMYHDRYAKVICSRLMQIARSIKYSRYIPR